MMPCRVNFLDDTHFVCELERNAVGQDLFSKVCERLNLLETDYFGLVMKETPTRKVWLDCAKEIQKQIKIPKTEFFFSIKFYPPDPSILAEDLTRYLLCLQLRNDILIGRLPCPSDILVLLGSYTIQSTLGDYDPKLHKDNYVSDFALAADQNEDMERKVMGLHSTYRFMSPAQADMLFLENVMGLPMYGVDLHQAKDSSGTDVMLGICSEGLMLFEEDVKTNVFPWPRVLKISYKRNILLLRIRPSEEDAFEGEVGFSLANYRACKQLWKCSVEHHSFFRNRLQERKVKRLFTLGSQFRHRGRTQSVCLENSGFITRAPPRFTRYCMRRKANSEIVDLLRMAVRAEVDDWFQVYGPEKWSINISDDIVFESQTEQEWKQQADDWCVLLDGSPFSLPYVEQPLQAEVQRAEIELLESSKEKISNEIVIKTSYKVQQFKEGSDIIEKELTDFEFKQEMMTPLKETVTEDIVEVNGERVQRVVVTKQWRQTQEVKTERVERHVIVVGENKLGSYDTFGRLEALEQSLEEVEAIEQRLAEVEELRVGLEEVEKLKQRLQFAEKEGLPLEKTDDWHLLLDCKPLVLTGTSTGEEFVVLKPLKTKDDWFIVFDLVPNSIASVHSGLATSAPEVAISKEKKQTQLREDTPNLLKEKQQRATVISGRSQTVVLEKGASEPQRDDEGDWFVVLDGPPSAIALSGSVEEMLEIPQGVNLGLRRTRWDVDDWFIVFDVCPKRLVHLFQSPAVTELQVMREEVITSRVSTEERLAQQVTETEDRSSQPVVVEQKPTQPRRDMEDDWFVIFCVCPKVSVLGPVVESRQEVIQSRWRKEERVIEIREERTAPASISFIQPPQFPVQPRDIEDDWFLFFDSEAYERRTFPAVVESRQEVVQSRWRKEERVVEIREERTAPASISFIQPPQFPVQPRDVEDDWFLFFDSEAYKRRTFPAEFFKGRLWDQHLFGSATSAQ